MAAYLNRELSWLEFNRRVLAEATNERNPLLEKLKFLAIFESNLDEFYMVRVSGLIEQEEAKITERTPDGLTPSEQLQAIAELAVPMRKEANQVWKGLLPKLQKVGVRIRGWDDLTDKQRADMATYFLRSIKPILTPLILDPAPSVPFISNRSLNLAVEISDESGPRIGRVKVPHEDRRFIPIPGLKNEFIALEDLVTANINELYPGAKIVGVHPFRLVRDADMDIRWLEAADLVSSVENTIHQRRFGDPVLLQVQPTMPAALLKNLMRMHALETQDVMVIDGLLALEGLWDLAALSIAGEKFPPARSYLSDKLATSDSLFAEVKSRDVVVHQPFDSFASVQAFIDSAATDPRVLGIKQTLYRVGKESPVVESLLEAAREGKQVAVMVELKARFDETNNITWARMLERAGVHVSYGFQELKTHCKLALVVRRQSDGSLRSFAHIGTGNYNPVTAQLYTDFGMFTSDPDITDDVATLFNYLTGFSKDVSYKRLLVAPDNLRDGILERIEREAAHGKAGRIIFKLNSLVDPEVIDALYEAAGAGVSIDCVVRGICCLIPRKNIRVRSIVGRFLEHSRAYYFGNNGQAELYIGSSDIMRRNLDRRVEVLAPISNAKQIQRFLEQVLEPYLRDTTNAWELQTDGTYVRVQNEKKPYSAQEALQDNPFSLRDIPTK
ncbi:MAG: polyphosphate kinase 1 [Chthonomonas sp.]|nr:polyphosphate kinase 1 [Chthonomonas sp.]